MKIENGKLILEQVTCWDCDGKKEVTRHDLCPYNYRPVNMHPGRVCPKCGAKNKHSHQTIGSHKEPCHTCNAQGVRMETLYDRPSKEAWAKMYPQFRFHIVSGNRGGNFNEQYLGLGLFGGLTDYRDWTGATPDEVKAEMDEHIGTDTMRQAIGYVNEKTMEVYLDIAVVLVRDGWHAYPMKPKAKA